MRPLIVLPIALLPLVLLAACDRHKAPPPQQSADAPVALPAPTAATPGPQGLVDTTHKGDAAPAKPFRDPAGAPATLATFRGKPLLVNLWATWCAPCVAELPTLDGLAASGDRLQVLVVSQDMGGKATVDPWLAGKHFKALKGYTDPDNGLMTALGAANLPTTVLYDAHGRELWRVSGPMDWTGAKAKALLAQAG